MNRLVFILSFAIPLILLAFGMIIFGVWDRLAFLPVFLTVGVIIWHELFADFLGLDWRARANRGWDW